MTRHCVWTVRTVSGIAEQYDEDAGWRVSHGERGVAFSHGDFHGDVRTDYYPWSALVRLTKRERTL